MYFHIAAGLMVIGFATFLAYFAVLIYSNSLIQNPDRNHFRNSFPYNFYSSFSIVNRVVLYVLLFAGTILTCIGESFFFISFQTAFTFILGLLLPLSLLCLVISNVMPMTFYKIHLITSGIGFTLFGFSLTVFAFARVIPSALNFASDLSLFIAVVIGFIGIISIASLINPKLKSWSKMDKTEENGTTYYVKPKVNWYALYEWIFLIFMQLTNLMLFLNIVITGAF